MTITEALTRKLDPNPIIDYWQKYYQVKHKIEQGKGTAQDYKRLKEYLTYARNQSEQVKINYKALGI